MVQQLRLTVRTYRLALAAVVAASVLMALLAIGASILLASLEAPRQCLDLENRFTSGCLSMSDFLTADQDIAGPVMGGLAILPFVAGVLVGGPLVAAELEAGTASLAWSLAVSRRRWLLERAAIVGMALVLALSLPAVAGTVLESRRLPWLDVTSAVFADYGARGPLLVARGLAAFSVAMAIGLVLGRVIPALTAGAIAATALYLALSAAQSAALPEPAYFLPEPNRYYLDYTGLGERSAIFLSTDGHQLRWDEILAAAPMGPDDPRFDVWFTANYRQLSYAIPGEKLLIVEQRELVGLVLLATAALAISVVTIERRRPA